MNVGNMGKKSKKPGKLPAAKDGLLVKPWEDATTLSPGSLYCVYSQYANNDARWPSGSIDHWLTMVYSKAIYRCPDLLTEEGRREYNALRSLRAGRPLYRWLEDSIYLSATVNIRIDTRARNVYAGELVLFLSEDELFYRVLKEEEMLLLDKAAFSFLLVRVTE
jgi:hypothetical protein